MDLEKIQQVKRIAIIALFSDDDLMEHLVLKGGNALDLIYEVAQRSSLDLDLSTDREFKESEIVNIEQKNPKSFK
ncbi:MAG: nucleotidyl transferase AbiEii/AbiGii toxin family protein [Planctomycetota bacterium]